MPLVNGDAHSGYTVPILRNQKPLDHTRAVEILQQEYTQRDGLDVHDLVDSKENGALTYNDFLILPGYIGIFFSPCYATGEVRLQEQASLLPKSHSTPQSPNGSR